MILLFHTTLYESSGTSASPLNTHPLCIENIPVFHLFVKTKPQKSHPSHGTFGKCVQKYHFHPPRHRIIHNNHTVGRGLAPTASSQPVKHPPVIARRHCRRGNPLADRTATVGAIHESPGLSPPYDRAKTHLFNRTGGLYYFSTLQRSTAYSRNCPISSFLLRPV